MLLVRVVIGVYLDLCESKYWFKVCIYFCKFLKLVYIIGKWIKKFQFDVVVLFMIDIILIIEEIYDIIQEVNLCEEEIEEGVDVCCSCVSFKVIMVFYEVDFIIVYYDFF